jgi:hypothetical protein
MESDKDDACRISLAFPSALLSSTGQAALGLLNFLGAASPANQSAALMAQSHSPGSVEDDTDDEDEVAGPATIASRERLLLDEAQQTELVNEGVKTVEDKLEHR